MIFTTVFGLLLTSGLATAHMQLAWPYPLHSALNHKSDPSTIDFSMTSPLESNGKSSTYSFSLLFSKTRIFQLPRHRLPREHPLAHNRHVYRRISPALRPTVADRVSSR